MAINYLLKLKGFVGGWAFDADYVDYKLAQHKDEEVHVLIDSLGGDVGTALSVCNAFRRHGNVTVHFVGLNASAATVASLGASRILIDASAMYLVHKVSSLVAEWASMNADQIAGKIAELEQQKRDLEKIDLNLAAMYAAKCKKPKDELLALMKQGGWLSAQEAKEWGFVDEIENAEAYRETIVPSTLAASMLAHDIPLSGLSVEKAEKPAGLSAFFSMLSGLFRPAAQSDTNHTTDIMKKEFTAVGKILNVPDFAVNDGAISVTDEQMQSINDTLAEKDARIAELENQVKSLKNEPGDGTTRVTGAGGKPEPESSAMVDFQAAAREANDLYKLI